MNINEIFQNFPALETDRLVLRQLDIEKDAEILFEDLYSDPEVIKYDGNILYEVGESNFAKLPKLSSMRSKMDLWENAFFTMRGIVWGLELKSNKKLIGIRLCEFFSPGIAIIECKICKKYWNNGLMAEASKKIIDFLEFHDVRQIITTINKNNKGAIALDKKLGFNEVDISNLYLSNNGGLIESISLQSHISKMQDHDERIYVKPRIDPMAFQFFEISGDAKNAGDLSSCVELNQKSLELQPDFIHAINGLAWAKLEIGDPNGAILEFNKLLRIKPNKYTGLLGRAYAFSDLQQWDEAVTDLVNYLKLQPNDSETFVLLGNFLFKAKRFKESVIAYNNALKINPNDQEAQEYKQIVMRNL